MLRWIRRFLQILVVAAILYAIFTRTAQQFVDESLPIAIFIGALPYSYFISRWAIFGPPRGRIQALIGLLVVVPLVVAVLTVFYYGIWVAIRDGYAWLEKQAPPRAFYAVLVELSILGIGYALFLFRLHARFFFGLTEALVGLIIGLHNIPSQANPVLWELNVFAIMLTASVFLLVRGFDNMHTGLKTEHGDVILKAFDESEYGERWRALRDGKKKS